MKKQIFRISFLVLFALVMGLKADPVNAQLGFAAGLNFDQFGDIEFSNSDATVDNSTGYHFGIFYDLAAGSVAIRPGIFFRNIQDVEYNVLDPIDSFDLTVIDVPIDLRLRMPSPMVAPYLLAGPVLSFASSNNDEVDESLKNLTMSANVGAGIEVNVPVLGVSLQPEIRYAFGLTSYMDDFEFLGSNVEVEDNSSRANAFMLRLGVQF